MTTHPQKKRNAIRIETELLNKNKGDMQQHKQDENNERVASFFTPNCWERYPLNTQARPPEEMTAKDNRGTFKSL